MTFDELFEVFARQTPDNTLFSRIEQASPNSTAVWLGTEVQRLSTLLHRPPICIEIGTWCGFTALAMAVAGARVICVDTFQGSDAQMAARGGAIRDTGHSALERLLANTFALDAGGRIIAVVGRSVEVAGLLSNGSADLVFIDADHDEDKPLIDLEHWGPKVRVGGTLCGHDSPQLHVMIAARKYCERHGMLDRLETDFDGNWDDASMWFVRGWGNVADGRPT